MKHDVGENVYYRFETDTEMHSAKVITVSKKGDSVVIQSQSAMPAGISNGQRMVIKADSGDFKAEVASVQGDTIHLKKDLAEKREYFRVDDVFPADAKKICKIPNKMSKLFSGLAGGVSGSDMADETVSPQLWKMLVDINAKLDMLLEGLQMREEGFTKIEHRNVNISASGIKFNIQEVVEVGDVVEVKLLLPTCPPVGVLTCGNVVRVTPLDSGEYEVAVHFTEMDDDAKEEIIQYALNRQREIIRRQRRGE